MLRGLYSIIRVLILALLLTCVAGEQQVNAEVREHHQQQKQELERRFSQQMETKYWVKNTEFGERSNWRNERKPCTLLESIRLNEHSVVSMGDSLDGTGGALEANIKDLVLATNGLFLLEEDTLSDQTDSMLIHCCEDCYEEDGSVAKQQEQSFEFEPDSDDMSWFNPDNWAHSLTHHVLDDWIPDSHRIPCSEDEVVFGSREASLSKTLVADERSDILSFKVNFRPSQWQESSDSEQVQQGAADTVSNIRVAKLKIGEQFYNQQEFEMLIKSNKYENILFEFNSSKNILKAEDGFAYPSHSLLTIDDSSFRTEYDNSDVCLDEAGCLCGNENANIMKAICSFVNPLEASEQPCYDPISSVGYCGRICATVITISMDPAKFSWKFVASTLTGLMTSNEELFGENVFTGCRRTSNNKYELTFRHVPSESANYETTLGRERKFAQLVYEKLNNEATKSFYGIKTISLKSSVDWRRNDRNLLFWTTFTAILLTSIVILTYQGESLSDTDSIAYRQVNHASDWFADTLRALRTQGNLMGRRELDQTTASYSEKRVSIGNDISASIPLVNIESSLIDTTTISQQNEDNCDKQLD